ncbi:hypothetical protein SCUCBS95973_003027 [Sporothrix curviconia]|uniref:Major facilitator superfamily (MFS) profile domain-containing protein n=1 Tax=Sporothrix curviconia TaxID=1260050 RepID=A0ABP0BBU5_9PEZI
MAALEKPAFDNVDHAEKSELTDDVDLASSDARALTRRILWKMDTRILPVLALLFLCSFLDRTNVGNARLYGLEKELGMDLLDHQYDQGLAVFYATYIVSEVPSNLVLKLVTPRIWLPFLTFAWGVVSMCQGFIRNFAGFVVVRAVLGFTEGGLLPGMILYLSGLYTRRELALRIGLFYTAASLSGAFGGLLARGLSEMAGRGGYSAWRWIFIIEGLLTVAVALIAAVLLPNGIAGASFLSDKEKVHAVHRLHRAVAAGSISPEREAEEKFSWHEVGRAVFSWQTWLTACAYFGILSGLYSFNLFLFYRKPV